MHAVEIPYLTTEQHQTLAESLQREFGIEIVQTVENVGRTLAACAQQLLDGDVVDRSIVVLAGRGMNGAGGLAAARHLLNRGAWVQVVTSDAADELHDDARQQLEILRRVGAPLAWAEEGWELPPADLLIDAIIGVGLRGDPRGRARDLIALANSGAAPILSLAIPSGIDSAHGTLFTPYLRATATLFPFLPPRALLVAAARQACGALLLGDGAVPAAFYESLGLDVEPYFHRDRVRPFDVVDGISKTL